MKKTIYCLFSFLIMGTCNLQAQNWLVGGNNLAANGKLGTNTNFNLIFETKNVDHGILTKDGLWGFGTNAPTAKAHIKSATGQSPLKVHVNTSLKLMVHPNGGLSVANSASVIPPDNGFLVAGNTGIGGVPGSYKAKIIHGTFGLNLENTTTKDDWEFWTNSGGLSLYANGSFRGNFNPTTGAYTAISDEREKTNIQGMPSVLERINQLKPATYQLTEKTSDKENTESYGFLAQQVMEVFPHLVTHHVDGERGMDTYSMDYSGFGVLAIKAIQELEQHIAIMETRIAQLEEALEASANGKNLLPSRIGIWQMNNAPNPFGQSTVIKYNTPEQAQQITMLITNLQGIEIRRFDNLTVGQGQVEITAGSLPNGTYIYTLVVDGKPIASEKMILNR